MFTEERRQRILTELQSAGRVAVTDLAGRYGVSEDTVRRDLRALAAEGFLQKTHGGAVALDTPHMTWQARSQLFGEVKSDIGKLAAALVEPGQTVLLDAGSTPLAVARALTVRPISVITNSLDVAQLFIDDREVTLLLTGGLWDSTRRHFVGEAALNALAGVRADWAFLGTCAVHPKAGITATDELDAQWKRALCRTALRVVLLADHSKFHQVVPYLVADLSTIEVLVTDQHDADLAATGVRMLVTGDDA